ncbi:LPKTxAVK-anchored surface protein [Streptococcus parasanguinis]|uniref:LPKTxAVK-anchored surface protein n=1 Tax=Streptococcus parasanguinis TaxID=1318 RepID=UPI002024B47F|nr:LPKTxAVK-anchored surface protein [Streptococcus parasanguinis]
MKKVLLSSVAALAVFAAAAPVFAEGELGANRLTEESPITADTSKEATFSEIKDANDKDLGTKSEKWTRDANKLKKDENLKVDKGEVEAPKADENKEVAKTPAPVAGQKALPKTSAVK